MQARVEEAFALFSLERLKNRNVYELSSGERQLISILSAWAMDTDVLLLDEPTANLDFAAIRQLREVLIKLKAQGKTLLLSEHRLYYLTGIADEYWLMENGRLVKRYTAEELLSLPSGETAALPIRTLDLNRVALSVEAPQEVRDSEILLFAIENLHFGYERKGEELLHDISFSARCGETVGLVGANGSGKTTLGKLLTGLLRPSAGTITLHGTKIGQKELQKSALFVMQEAEFQFFTNSVMNELRYGIQDTPEFRKKAERLLKKFGMWEYRNRHPFSLSGGQMQKLSLMIAYFSPKQIVTLDGTTVVDRKKNYSHARDIAIPYDGRELSCQITHTILRGRVLMRDGLVDESARAYGRLVCPRRRQ